MRPLFDINNIQPGFHLVLSKEPNEATYWMNQLHDKFGNEVVNFYHFGDGVHRSLFKSNLDRLLESKEKLFLSTMNPDVVNSFYWNDVKDLRRRLIIVEDGGDGLFIGVNLTHEEAYRLNQAYDVGIQHVREILWCEGIW